jgi:HK97 gp10 family phage protein
MAQNGHQFNVKLEQWAKGFAGDMDALARQTSQQIALNVVKDTPVDTGFLRGSWQPAIGGEKFRDGKNVAEDGGAAVIADVMLTATQMRAGQKFYMMNNAKYAGFVEFGTSRMRPRLFVTRNIKRARSVVSAIAKQLGAK